MLGEKYHLQYCYCAVTGRQIRVPSADAEICNAGMAHGMSASTTVDFLQSKLSDLILDRLSLLKH